MEITKQKYINIKIEEGEAYRLLTAISLAVQVAISEQKKTPHLEQVENFINDVQKVIYND